jgi:putative flippase GtrA
MWSKTLSYIVVHRWQLIRFCIVGLATFALNFFLVWLFYGKAVLDYRIAVSCAYFITVVAHFILNRSFTYSQKGGSMAPDTVKYCIMLLANYLITLSITTATVELARLTPYYGIVFATFATAFSSFLLMKHFVFVQKEFLNEFDCYWLRRFHR